MTKPPPLKAPFPYFGGKSKVAHLVWEAFGDTPNYVEPFFGSGAVLIGRPFEARIETVNDDDCMVSNFWRAVASDPEGVASAADWPVNEADLHARHRWLVGQKEFRERMHRDPHFFDVVIAGWWVWGICQWIGGGWCSQPNDATRAPTTRATNRRTRDLGNASEWMKRPSLGKGARGIESGGKTRAVRSEQLPSISGSRSATGRGVHASGLHNKVPMIAGAHGNAGRGVQASGLLNKIPILSAGHGVGVGVHNAGVKYGPVYEWMFRLQDRLRKVRVCCGNWDRILGPSATTKIGLTGVFLDPPYSSEAGRDPNLYARESGDVAHQTAAWAIAHGEDPLFRIAICGYEGEHQMPDNWKCVAWKSNGGYASAAGNTANAERERIWFSPHCLGLKPKAQRQLFGDGP